MKTAEIRLNGKDFTGGFFDKLLKAAIEVREKAYCPYSGYKVGCALVDEQGRIFVGNNVENVAYTGTHAEASAIAAMKAAGGTAIRGMVCVTENGGASCGDCRQRIWEFSGGDGEMMCYFVDLNRDEVLLVTIGRLLPYAFTFDFSKTSTT